MASRWTELVIDCDDAERLAVFWCGVLDYQVVQRDAGSVEIAGQGSGPTLLFQPVDEAKTTKNRLHIDVNPVAGSQSEEVERLLELGARRIDIGQHEVSWVVLADPEGNEFCVLRSTVNAEPGPARA